MADVIIDVSQWQGNIDWDKVKPQIKGAIIRIGFGSDMTNQDDTKVDRNITECVRLGIPFGVYIYSYALSASAGVSEANHVLRILRKHSITPEKLALPVYFDAEDRTTVNTSKIAYPEFYKTMKAAGYRTGLYTYISWIKNFPQNARVWDSMWMAAYGTNNGLKQENYRPKPGFAYDLWQYTSMAYYNGIVGSVDTNEITNPNVFANNVSVSTTVASTPVTPSGTTLDLVVQVIKNNWAGDTRKAKMGTRYDEVQKFINHICNTDNTVLADEVLAGKYGNSEVRRTVLSVGNKYEAVQKIVEAKLAAKKPTPKPVEKKADNSNALIRVGQQHSVNFTGVAIAVDGVGGTQTQRQKVRVLQRALNLDYRSNLALDGVFGKVSAGVLGSNWVKRGEKQYMVTALEILLYMNGYNADGVECPGIFGASLEACVKRYQKDHGLVADGIAGSKTFTTLIA